MAKQKAPSAVPDETPAPEGYTVLGTPLRANLKLGGDVAQLGEHLVRNEGVVGSNPIISTIFLLGFLGQAQRNPKL